jgi:hypothetical protein
MMYPDEAIDELTRAIDHDQELQLLLALSKDFRRLVELAAETGRRHHELYMSWLAALAAIDERTPPSGSFVPRFAKK